MIFRIETLETGNFYTGTCNCEELHCTELHVKQEVCHDNFIPSALEYISQYHSGKKRQ